MHIKYTLNINLFIFQGAELEQTPYSNINIEISALAKNVYFVLIYSPALCNYKFMCEERFALWVLKVCSCAFEARTLTILNTSST